MIEELEKKGFRIGIRPQRINGVWYWVAGVNIGDNDRADWVDIDNGLPWACYRTYKEALDEAIKYCNKPHKVNERSSKTKVSRKKL